MLEINIHNNYMCIPQTDLHYYDFHPSHHICNASACINFSFRLSIKKYIIYTTSLHREYILLSKLKRCTAMCASECMLLSAKSAIAQLHHCNNKLHFKDMRMISALYLTNTLSWIFIVLAPWKESVDLSLH
jgi:hypothetical protein